MSVSLSNMGSVISRMAAEAAIDSSDTNRLISRSGADLSEAMIERKNAEKETANDLKAASAYVQMASSAVNVAKAGVKVGQEANNLAQRSAAEPDLTRNVGAGQAESARAATAGTASTERSGDGSATAQVMRTSLGNGLTVGERFGENGTRALLRPDLGARMNASHEVTETRAQWDTRVGASLRSTTGGGLSASEVDQVWAKARDGRFDTQDAVNFMWDNRKSTDQAKQDDFRNKLMEGIQGQTTAFLTRQLGETAKQAGKNAKRLGEEAGKSSEVADRARDSTNEHNEHLGDLDLQNMRQRRGATALR